MILRILFLTLLCCSPALGQICLQRAEEIAPPLTRETRRDFEAKLAEAKNNFDTNQTADNLIWFGRRTAYLGHYKEAIRIFSVVVVSLKKETCVLRRRVGWFVS